jgi:integrase
VSYVEPITNKQHLKKCSRYITQNFDSAYSLIWQIGIEAGYRITDITQLKYSNINFTNNTIKIAENKGSKSSAARAKLKVLEQVKNELIALHSNDNRRMMQVFITKPKDVYSLIPEQLKPLIDSRINEAMTKAPLKYRTAKLSPGTVKRIQTRMAKYSFIDNGDVFARSTLGSNRSRNTDGVITRQSCYRVFSRLTAFMATLGEVVKVACHSLRKIFARHLYVSSNNNIGLLMKTIGHSSAEMSLRYIGINDSEQLTAIDNMFAYYDGK